MKMAQNVMTANSAQEELTQAFQMMQASAWIFSHLLSKV